MLVYSCSMNFSLRSSAFIGGFCALAATIIWSGNFVIARGLVDSVPPISLAFWRWTLAILVFLPFALKPMLRAWQPIRIHLGYLTLTALCGVTLFNTLIYIASHSTSAINLSLIAITFPIFVILLARFYWHERITRPKAIGVGLVIIGVINLVTQGKPAQLLSVEFAQGDIWMLAAAICFALYSVMVKRKPAALGAWAFQLITFIIGWVLLLPFYLWEASNTHFQIHEADLSILAAIAYVGVAASLLAFVLWGHAIALLGPTTPAIIYYSLPIFSGLAAYLFLGETLGSIHLLSAGLILAGLILAIYRKDQAQR